MRLHLIVLAALALLFAHVDSAAADDRRVFLNGVDLTGVKLENRTFESCTVRFDAEGNLHITAEGFRIQKKRVDRSGEGGAADREAPERRRPRASLAGARFYLVASPVDDGLPSPYRMAIYVNGRLVDFFEPSGSVTVEDVSRYLRKGKNKVRIVARRAGVTDAGKRSYSPKDRVEIVLGRGTVKKGSVVIRVPLLEYSRNASETRSFDNTYTVELE